MLCCLNVHLYSTTWYVKNTKDEKRPEIKSRKGSEDF